MHSLTKHTTIAEITMTTTRERKEDWSGNKAYKVVTTNTLHILARPYYRVELELAAPIVSFGSQRKALQKAMDWIGTEQFYSETLREMEHRAAQAGVSFFKIMEAQNENLDLNFSNLSNLINAAE